MAVSLFAAGSLKQALGRLARQHEAATGTAVALKFGASGLLRERITRGEAADLFASADLLNPNLLAIAGGWRPPVVFTRNRLCAMVLPGLAVAPATLLDLMLRPDVRVGTSTPGADPSGDYAWMLFGRADRLRRGAGAVLGGKALKLTGSPAVPKPPAGQYTYAWIMAQRQADVFLTYRTNAVAAARDVPGLQVVDLPPALAVEATYGLTVRDGAGPAADAVAAMLLAAPAQALLKSLGFGGVG